VRAPQIERLDGLRVLGRIEETIGGERVATYDLAPVDERVERVPPIAFSFFDPNEPAGYRTVETEPIPLVVRPAPPEPSTSRAASDAPEAGPLHRPPRTGRDFGTLGGIALTAALAIALVAIARRASRRRHSRLRTAAESERAHAAASAFRARVKRDHVDTTAALSEFVAQKLDRPAAAVITPDLAQHLVQAGVDHDLAARTAAALERLLAARYGGAAPPDLDSLARLVAELEAAFSPGSARA